MATRLGLRGNDIELSMTKVGNVTDNYYSKEYCLPLSDKQGNVVSIRAVGIKEISSTLEPVDVSKLVTLFEGIETKDIARPCGNIDLLVGSDCCDILPRIVKINGNLQLLENQFGYSIRGSHPILHNITSNTNHVRIRTHHLAGLTHASDIDVECKSNLKTSLDSFFNVESLGTQCTPRCGGCKCGNCPIGSNNYTIKEERELALIDKGLKYDANNKLWTAHYPWIKDPHTLSNNVTVAIAKMKATERRLVKLGSQYANVYQSQLEDMVNRGVARKLTAKELIEYDGPIHYIHHHDVMKPDSTSTPVRIVFISSASYMGQTLNDFWPKGPDILNGLLGVLLRFRQEEVAIVGDVSKMHNTIKLSKFDQHTHRLVWRDLNVDRKPDHYVLTAVPFGDRPSGIISTLALRRTANMHKDNFPEVAKMINNNTYVDDILYSISSRPKAYELIKNTEAVLSEGGFVIKHWIVSGKSQSDVDINLLDTEREEILGLNWSPKDDRVVFRIKMNFSPKRKKLRTGPDLTPLEFETRFPDTLTRRTVLSQVASIYDPLGFVLPYTLLAKILVRELVTDKTAGHSKGNGINWDEPLSEQISLKWKKIFFDLYEIDSLVFNRCVKPCDAVGKPTLVVFSDGSTQAYGTCAYIRWKVESGEYVSKLIAAKNRIAPNKQLTIPRLELCGAVLACRLRDVIQRELDWSFKSVIHIVDSAIVRSQIQNESYGFGTFVATRVAEIQTKSNPSEWWWVATEHNPADLTTRPHPPCSLGSQSVWQNGPKYLSRSVSEWPISQSYETCLPDKVKIHVIHAKTDPFNLEFIQVERFSSYNKLLRVTSRLLTALRDKYLKGIGQVPNAEIMKKAEIMWIKEVQKSMSDWKVKYIRLGATMIDGMIAVGQRMSKWLKDNWNREYFILLSANHPFTKLYVLHVHNLDHAGVESTMAKIQSKFWIPGIRKIIKSTKKRCVTCRRLNSSIEGQSMGQLGPEQLQPSPPFYNTAIDLFGPFSIKDTVKRRTRSKAYGVIFNCLSSRAVHIDLADGYDTESFLTTFRRFVCIRGYPRTVHSDGGTQLVAASKELNQITKGWKFSEILNFGTKEGMEWIFNKSADAPWQNGCSEALIRLIKRSLTLIIGDSVLTFGELQTVLFEVANMLNERPIGIKPCTDPDLGTYLCPNDLILGRASTRVPWGPFAMDASPKQRSKFIQRIVDGFWRKWQRDYFPTLVVRQKWHVQKRNLRPGDIVIVQDSNAVRGVWRLAQVLNAEPGRDGKVRDVSLRYKIQKPGKRYNGQEDKVINRSVHRLVVLLPVEEQTS
ncbi:hypothetical protein Pmani_023247 [Petrolisthes manimaculis]|uniref:Integrase catalytic domain-containing protein n=1 Tax=Petrolisthes manimaculis TaxID=1843537 RepID=A0AAE1PC99_9EUCA|nr:hypothetical protein Pmani_023247 [Petrolisthes manimaculis]